MARHFAAVWITAFLGLTAGTAWGQGITNYLNFESPQVKALAVATLSGTDYLLACNTPDNSVEVFEVTSGMPGLVSRLRVPVGQEPVSVLWDPGTRESEGYFYTCNMIGDSVSRVKLFLSGGTVAYEVDTTVYVGDEPMHAAIHGNQIYVSLQSSSRYVTLNTNLFGAPQDQLMIVSSGGEDYALAAPRTVVIDQDYLMVLGHRGFPLEHIPFTPNPGGPNCSYSIGIGEGLDLYIEDLSSPGTVLSRANLGTANFNMVSHNGALLVVSSDARTHHQFESNVRDAEFGFVESYLHYIADPLAGIPETRNLNEEFDMGASSPVDPTQGICQPTDVVAYEPSGGALRVFVCSFGTDRIAVVDGVGSFGSEDWAITLVDQGTSAVALRGPRSLAVSYGDSTTTGDDKIFALNKLTNDITVIEADTLTFSFMPLLHDPVPPHIRDGQSFLYSGLLSGNQFVSCASCHIDGRLDARSWNLGENLATSDGEGADLSALLDLPSTQASNFDPDWIDPQSPQYGWLSNKGAMATQSLQGLLNWEIDSSFQRYVTNAPYHWRGDRRDFVAFRKAFVTLMGAPADADGFPLHPTAQEMTAFETFINSVAYPPNPAQPQEREYSGDFGNPRHTRIVQYDGSPLDEGDGAQLGLKAMRIHVGASPDMTCDSCHSLPEGSSNLVLGAGMGFSFHDACGAEPGVNEVPSLRGLRQKENVFVEFDHSTPAPTIRTGPEFGGMLHSGAASWEDATINDQINANFSNQLGADITAVIAMARELDTGTAPIVGSTFTGGLFNPVATATTFSQFEEQAFLGNCGLAVQLFRPNEPVSYRGFRYLKDLTGNLDYVEVDGGANPGTAISQATLRGLVVGASDRLVLHCTPLGSERRVATENGNPLPLADLSNRPKELVFLPMEPNVAHWRIPQLVDYWDTFPPLGSGYEPLPNANSPGTVVGHLYSLTAMRVLQRALISAGQLPGLRHEAPRRFLIAGENIRHGAVLRIEVASQASQAIELPLYPTGRFTTASNSRLRIWTTAIELEPNQYLSLMVGGDSEPYVRRLFGGSIFDFYLGIGVSASDLETIIAPGFFDPTTKNSHTVEVHNADGTFGRLKQQRIELSDPFAPIPTP